MSETCQREMPASETLYENASRCTECLSSSSGGRKGRVIEHRIQADSEAIDRVAGPREPIELLDHLVDTVPELRGRSVHGSDARLPRRDSMNPLRSLDSRSLMEDNSGSIAAQPPD